MINYISKPFKWFFKLEAASGLVLLFAAIIALFISNSNLADLYFSTLNKYLFIGINNFGLKLSVIHWINDALMAIFFFFVTLEIKREFIQGELSNIKQALLPIIAAVGGMVVPALFYVFINLQLHFRHYFVITQMYHTHILLNGTGCHLANVLGGPTVILKCYRPRWTAK